MVNLGLSRVDDAVADKHPVRRPAGDAGPGPQKRTRARRGLDGSAFIGEEKRDRGRGDPLAVEIEASRVGMGAGGVSPSSFGSRWRGPLLHGPSVPKGGTEGTGN